MTRRYFSGSTLDQAVMMAARHHGIDPDELAYRQIEKRHGFLRTRKAVMIAVDPDHPRREPDAEVGGRAEEVAPPPAEAPAPEVPLPKETAAPPEPPPADERPVAPETPAAAEPPAEALPEPVSSQGEPEDAAAAAESGARVPYGAEPDDEMLAAAERATGTLLQFAGIEGEATARKGPERVEVEIEGPDSSVLVVEGGKGLLAIQHLLPRMLRGLTGRSSFVRADSRDFHRKRRERLEGLAHKEAEAAQRNGSARTLPPMAPDERRIVHLALKDNPTVFTESRGSGLHKRVVIRPAEDSREREDIEARHGI